MMKLDRVKQLHDASFRGNVVKNLAFIAVAALALTACAGMPQSQQGASQPGASVASVAANAVPADEPEAADEAEDLAEAAPTPTPEPAKVAANRHMRADGDDYRYVSGMTAYSATPGWKGQRQLEIEKIHTLSKACIAANNTSKACNDLIALNSRMGKFYILQESGGMK